MRGMKQFSKEEFENMTAIIKKDVIEEFVLKDNVEYTTKKVCLEDEYFIDIWVEDNKAIINTLDDRIRLLKTTGFKKIIFRLVEECAIRIENQKDKFIELIEKYDVYNQILNRVVDIQNYKFMPLALIKTLSYISIDIRYEMDITKYLINKYFKSLDKEDLKYVNAALNRMPLNYNYEQYISMMKDMTNNPSLNNKQEPTIKTDVIEVKWDNKFTNKTLSFYISNIKELGIEINRVNIVKGIKETEKTNEVLNLVNNLKPSKVIYYDTRNIMTEKRLKEYCESEIEIKKLKRFVDFLNIFNRKIENNNVIIIDAIDKEHHNAILYNNLIHEFGVLLANRNIKNITIVIIQK